MIANFCVNNFCVNFFRGSKNYLHEKSFTRKNVTLSFVIIFYMRTHIRSIKYAMAAAIKCVHQRACCVRGYHVYREIWVTTIG